MFPNRQQTCIVCVLPFRQCLNPSMHFQTHATHTVCCAVRKCAAMPTKRLSFSRCHLGWDCICAILNARQPAQNMSKQKMSKAVFLAVVKRTANTSVFRTGKICLIYTVKVCFFFFASGTWCIDCFLLLWEEESLMIETIMETKDWTSQDLCLPFSSEGNIGHLKQACLIVLFICLKAGVLHGLLLLFL